MEHFFLPILQVIAQTRGNPPTCLKKSIINQIVIVYVADFSRLRHFPWMNIFLDTPRFIISRQGRAELREGRPANHARKGFTLLVSPFRLRGGTMRTCASVPRRQARWPPQEEMKGAGNRTGRRAGAAHPPNRPPPPRPAHRPRNSHGRTLCICRAMGYKGADRTKAARCSGIDSPGASIGRACGMGAAMFRHHPLRLHAPHSVAARRATAGSPSARPL
ncbi:hypothetical protein DND132_0559 [Pseudodesulfovibrio mercurii]|uniref:Uncharacterized protein n=1 Tax=Pseudodesulfovibrio mercurii TaxID=641491 RepID=F0JFU7_9BACT|nr:hypothetical protein DND132_0559 [Pseudodesulfovibrio mercurii]